MNEIVKKYMLQGKNRRTAYRLAKREHVVSETKESDFDYDAECPKGEWV